MLLIADETTIAGWGDEGLLWCTERLGFDQVTIDNVADGFVYGRGWSPVTDGFVDFEVSLADISHEGGASPEKDLIL